MFACPRDNGANALRLRFREGTSSESRRNANHAFTECRSISRPSRPSARHIGWRMLLAACPLPKVYFPSGAVMPRRLPHSTLLHLPMGGDQSSHSVKRKSNENSCLAEARTLGRGSWRTHPGHRRFLTTRVENGNDCRSVRPGARRDCRRRGTCAILRREGPERTQQAALASSALSNRLTRGATS